MFLGIIPNREDYTAALDLFVHRYDLDLDKKLLFTDIGKAFLSTDPKYESLVIGR